jgi:sec-independent protein translocase protein TatA
MELIVVLVLALVVLGPKRLPEAGRSLGKGLREFKDSISGNDNNTAKIEEHFQNEPAHQMAQHAAAAEPAVHQPVAAPVAPHAAEHPNA